MDLKDYGRTLGRYWISIAVCALLGLLLALASSLLVRPTYSAHTQLFVAIQSAGSVAELQQGNTFTQARVQSYVETVKTPAVLQSVIDGLGLEDSPSALAERVRATSDLNTVLLTISAEDGSPSQAAAIAQGVAESLIATVGNLESPTNGGASPVKLSVVTPAVAPTEPSSRDARLIALIGLFCGLAVGVGVAVLRSTLDTKVRGESDVIRLSQKPILGGVAFDADAAKKPLLTQAPPQSPRAESFRQIRTNLQFANVSSSSKSLLVTSSLPGEGKSTTAINMAIAMAQDGRRVALIDADLRRPSVAEYLGLEGNAGLTTVLVGDAEVTDLLQPWGTDDLFVLSSGQIPPNPSELLGSKAMIQLVQDLEKTFDTVIIDAPPLIPVTDASVLAQEVGGVVVVVGATKIKTQDLEKSMASLSLVGANILGMVVNLLPTKGPDAYAYSYYTYESAPDARRIASSSKSLSGSHLKDGRRSRADTASATVSTENR